MIYSKVNIKWQSIESVFMEGKIPFPLSTFFSFALFNYLSVSSILGTLKNGIS